MSVLDPFEVAEIAVWPLPQFQTTPGKDKKHPTYPAAKAHLNALERLICEEAISKSRFRVILNEKDPPVATIVVPTPIPLKGSIVSGEMRKLRGHADVRIARRALTISRLAQVISERKIEGGLRRVLVAQSQRLLSLAERRYKSLGGPALVEREVDGDESDEAASDEE
jgi:hypothetical protein